MSVQVLIVEDDGAMRDLLVEDLADRGYAVGGVSDEEEAVVRFEADRPGVVVTDLNLARGSGLRLCRRILALDPDVPVILITAFGSMDAAIEAIRAGAYDFLTKPFQLDTLALAVERASRLRSLRTEVEALRVTVRRQSRTSRLDGVGPKIARLRESLATVAATDATVVLLGESGAGKEVVAREVHDLSRRAKGPFVAENVAAIPGTLLESALFGHVRGAFTGAATHRDGLFRRAHGGTLLLDEIGELPLELQPKLLRVLEEGRVRPVGSDVEVPIDVRLLVATHRDLEAKVRDGSFRADLYYRLAVIDLHVPALRERGGDVLLLAQRFLEEFATALDRPIRGLHTDAAARLLAYSWPGNVRELRNAMERAVVLARGPWILPTDLPARLHEVIPPELPTRLPDAEADLCTLADVERRHALRVLQALQGNKAQAARVLGIGRKTLYRKLESWGVPLDADEDGSERDGSG
jgi:two-component system response regulator HydG